MICGGPWTSGLEGKPPLVQGMGRGGNARCWKESADMIVLFSPIGIERRK